MPLEQQPVSQQYKDVDAAIAANLQSPSEMAVYSVQRKRRPRLKVTGVVLGCFVLLAGGGFAAFIFLDRPTQPGFNGATTAITGEMAQSRFNSMLSRAMDVSFVRQTVTYKGGGADTGQLEMTFVADSDFSNPVAPRTQGTLTSRLYSGDAAVEAVGSYVLLGDTDYIKLDERGYTGDFPGSASQQLPSQAAADALKGRWLQMDGGSQPLLNDIFFVDIASLDSLNRAENELIVGNIADTVQEQLLAFASTQRFYAVQSAEMTTLDGVEVTKLNVGLDTALLGEYLRLSSPVLSAAFDARSSMFAVYVDNQTGLPKRLEISEAGQSVTIDYSSFGVPVEIAAPVGAANPDDIVQ